MSGLAWEKIRAIVESEGHSHFGFAPLENAFSFALYEKWLEKGYHGEMEYLERHSPFKQDPTKLMEKAQSAIVIAFDYVTHPEPVSDFPLKEAKVARYAQGFDYHFWIKDKLRVIIRKLEAEFGSETFACYTDSAPVLERDLANRAGLGWIGKNTCVLGRERGSLFLIGEIFTSVAPDTTVQTMRDFCGTCTRCIDACPTGAIVAPRELDATKCISYLTIESKSTPAPELRAKMEGWFFGCDICQTVCPWNIKVHGAGALSAESGLSPADKRERLIEEMRTILTSSNSKLLKMFHGTPLVRAGARGLRRNAAMVVEHAKLSELYGLAAGVLGE